MKLVPIQEHIEDNQVFVDHPDCKESIQMCVDYYKSIGFNPPWLMYYAQKDGQFVGNVGFKGKPINNKIEIAYGTFEQFRQQGIATEMCKKLVELALATDDSIEITARTLPNKNYSTCVLEKNGFTLLGLVMDKDDGEVWEWKYQQ